MLTTRLLGLWELLRLVQLSSVSTDRHLRLLLSRGVDLMTAVQVPCVALKLSVELVLISPRVDGRSDPILSCCILSHQLVFVIWLHLWILTRLVHLHSVRR